MKTLTTAIHAAILAALPLATWAQDVPPVPASSLAQDLERPGSEIVTIKMTDGSSLVARVIDQDDQRLRIVTAGGLAMEIARASVERIDRGGREDASSRPSDSNYTRLLFSPTGRPLGKGEGYFSDHYVVFPGVAYGITDHLSVGAGVSVVPSLGLGEQLFYVAPRFGQQFSERVAVSAGVLYAHAGGEGDQGGLGLGFAMATLGKPDKSLTLGGGVARTIEYDSVTRIVNGRTVYETRKHAAHTPVIVVGGTVRVAPRIALVSENWLVLHEDFNIKEQPFALGVRFLGDRLSADVGVILIGELIDEGFPIPWLSVTYHFGRRR